MLRKLTTSKNLPCVSPNGLILIVSFVLRPVYIKLILIVLQVAALDILLVNLEWQTYL